MEVLLGLVIGFIVGLPLWLLVFHWTMTLWELLKAPGKPSPFLRFVGIPALVLFHPLLWLIVAMPFLVPWLVLLAQATDFWLWSFVGSCIPLALLANHLKRSLWHPSSGRPGGRER